MFKSSVPPDSLIEFIKKGKKFIIAGHSEPDADCIGSQLALFSLFERLGKQSVLCSAGPFKRTEILKYEYLFKSEVTSDDKDGASLVIVDCSSKERIGDQLCTSLSDLPSAIIDHHFTGGKSSCDISYTDSEAPSATVMIFSVIKAFGQPTKEEARLLFLGLCTDTGFFRHLDSDGAATFEIAAELVRLGANPKSTFAEINGGKSFNSRLLIGAILSRAEQFYDGKLIVSTEELGEKERYGLSGRDSDAIYQLLQSIDGVEAVALIRQESDENCTAGLRSRDSVDISSVAAVFGGGGHKNASGFITKGKLINIRDAVIKEFGKIFGDSN
jgi:phosphoesterase RecJ-like protein